MAVVDNNYAAYAHTEDGDYPLRDLDAQDKIRALAPAIIETASGESILLTDSGEQALQGLNLYGQSTQESTTGAQLFDSSRIATTSQGGATVTNNWDGSFTISGSGNLTADFDTSYRIVGEDARKILRAGTINSNGYNNVPRFYVYGRDSVGSSLFTTYSGGTANITEENLTNLIELIFVFYSVTGETITPITFSPMVYQTGDGTWEPYTGGAPSPSPDYPQEIVSKAEDGNVTVTVTGGDADAQALTVSTPNGLPGIPVTSGGNYTDETGQQWVCDEVDFKRGVYVQRIGKVTFDGDAGEYWNKNLPDNADDYLYYITLADKTNSYVLCDKLRNAAITITTTEIGIFGNNVGYPSVIYVDFGTAIGDNNVTSFKSYLQSHPITVLYKLATPVETPLSPTELSAYAGMHTNYPTTTVINDEGAYMSLEYAADTETYISNNYVDKTTYNALEDRVAALEGAAVANV